jgi:hypothetical protein
MRKKIDDVFKMKNELVAPLQAVLHATDELMADTDETLNALQSQCVRAIHQVSGKLMELIVSIPDLNWEKARTMLDFETRSHLASIIGYAEVLLDQDEGTLTHEQEHLVHQIRAGGKLVLNRLAKDD